MNTSFFSNDYKKYILLFPLGILIGSILINIAGIDKINEWGIFNTEIAVKNNIAVVAEFVLGKRLWHFTIVFLMCFSTLKDKLFLLFVGWLGIAMGIAQSVFLIQYGLWGMLAYIILICLHSLVYFFATMGLLAASEKNSDRLWEPAIILVFVSYSLGIVLEIFISTFGLPLILNWLNNV